MVKYIVAFVISALLGTLVSLHVSLTETKMELAEAKLHVGQVLVREDLYQRQSARRLAKATVVREDQEKLLARAAIEIEDLRVKVAAAAAESYNWENSYKGAIQVIDSLKEDIENVRCRKPVKAVPAREAGFQMNTLAEGIKRVISTPIP